MGTSNRAILKFYSDTSQIARLSIPRANINKTAENARTAMEQIIASGAVATTNGVPISVHGAELVSTQRTSIVSNA